MRMDLSKNETALAFLERISKDELITILQENSDEVMAVQIATCLKMIPIPTTTVELSERIRKTVKDYATKEGAEKPTKEDLDSTVARTMQAIRIEVNHEMDVLKEFLEQSLELLNPNGRLSVISYHSLEDRLVKRFMKNGMFNGEPERDFFGNFSVPFNLIGKLIVPSEAEIKINNRARSAKLRIAEKK